MYAYCGNNPVMRVDPSGQEWWHWAIAAAIVVACAAAVVITAGGAAPAIMAVAMVSNGLAAATTASTIAAGAFIGSSFTLAGAATATAISSTSLKDFADQGSWWTIAATGGGAILGGLDGANIAAPSKSACFVAGTAVYTEEGCVPIEKVHEGMLVYASDPETGENGLREVVRTFVNTSDELIHLTTSTGEKITTTPTHPFYVSRKGWTDAVNLRAGDILLTLNGKLITIEQVAQETLDQAVSVYNFEVAGIHTYFVGADGVLVHNKCNAGTDQTKPTSPKKVGDDYIKSNKIDAHGFKYDNGVKRDQSKWDIFQDTKGNNSLWLGNKAQNVWKATTYFFKDLMKWKK